MASGMKAYKVILGWGDDKIYQIAAKDMNHANKLAHDLQLRENEKIGATTDIFQPRIIEELFNLTDI